MILLVHTDTSYLSKPGGKSRAAGHFYLSDCNDEDFNNGAYFHPVYHHQSRHVVSNQSRTCRTLLRLQTCHPTSNHTGETRPLPIDSHSRHHQQRHCPSPNNGNNDTQGLQINRSMLSLAQMMACVTPVPVSLGKGYPQSRRLLQ
jgi:hypothetical protein